MVNELGWRSSNGRALALMMISKTAVVVAWQIEPGQEIPAHFHPHGQDTWMIISGKGKYYLDRSGTTRSIVTGDVVIAPTGSIHGVFNNGNEPLIFISIVAPGEAGYERLTEFTRSI